MWLCGFEVRMNALRPPSFVDLRNSRRPFCARVSASHLNLLFAGPLVRDGTSPLSNRCRKKRACDVSTGRGLPDRSGKMVAVTRLPGIAGRHATYAGRQPPRQRHPAASSVAAAAGNDGWRSNSVLRRCLHYVRFSNRPVGVKRFQAVHLHSVDVAREHMLLFGIGTQALP